MNAMEKWYLGFWNFRSHFLGFKAIFGKKLLSLFNSLSFELELNKQYFCFCDVIFMLSCQYLSTNYLKNTQAQFVANFNLFKTITKNIVDMHCEHDVLGFFKHRQKH